mgnify:CR=1 FL=1
MGAGSDRWQEFSGRFGQANLRCVESGTPGSVHVTADVTGLSVVYGHPTVVSAHERQQSALKLTLRQILQGGRVNAQSSLRAAFAGALWKPDLGRFVAFRDKFGQLPVFFYEAQGIVAVATDPMLIIESFNDDFSPNRRRLAAMMMKSCDFSRDYFFRNISRLRARERIRWSLPEMKRECDTYWQPERGDRLKEAPGPATIRANLRDAVEVNPGDSRIIALSGGLDSTILAGLEAQLQGQNEGWTATMDSKLFGSRHQSSQTAAVARELSLKHFRFDISDHLLVDEKAFDDIPIAWGPLSNFGEAWLFPFLDAAARRSGRRVMVTGFGADELFGASRQCLLDALISEPTQTREFLRVAFRFLSDGRPEVPLKSLFRRLPSRIGEFKRKIRNVHAGIQSWTRPWNCPERWVRPVDEWCGVSASVMLEQIPGYPSSPGSAKLAQLSGWERELYFLSMHRSASMTEVSFSFPMLDPVLWEMSVGLPPIFLRTYDTDKLLLRRVAEELLPEFFWNTPYQREEGVLGSRVLMDEYSRASRLMEDSRLVRLELVDPDAFLEVWAMLLKRFAECDGPASVHTPLWRVLAAELWLRRAEDDDRI